MQAPSFWWREGSLAARLLAPAAALYGAVAARRMAKRGASVGIPVVCIGNLTVGGAGKTPTAIAVATTLTAAGEKPFFLTRGYGGTLGGTLGEPVRVGPSHSSADVGDEPLLLARHAPTIVARDRAAGATTARGAGASVIVMDDGFQNPSLAKDLALLVVDARRGIGNTRVFPAGPLRAPLDAQLAHAKALLMIGEGAAADEVTARAGARGIPVLRGTLEPDASAVAAMAGRKVLAFAGIGDPEKFFATLAAAGIDAVVRRGFADHHRFTAQDAADLVGEADRRDLMLVTTEKDVARMAGDAALAGLAQRAHALPVTLAVSDEARFRDLVLEPFRL